MSRVPHSHLPYGAMGVGLFGQVRTKQNLTNVRAVQDKILEAVEKIPIRSGNQLFTIGDYGCADGACSIPLLGHIIRHVRERAQKPVPVQVIYEDQPIADFNSLFKRIHGLIPEPRSYLQEFSNVYVMATATNFFNPVMPPDTGDVILSFSAAHYLWGVLCVAMPAYDPKGTLNGVLHCIQGIEETILKTWKNMRDESLITQEEFVNTNMHRCPKTEEECTSPFLTKESAVRQQGLELVSADLLLIPCATKAEWRTKLEKEGVDQRDVWSRANLQQHRIWCNSPFFQALSDARARSEKEALVDEMFARVQSEIEHQGPEQFMNDYLMVYVLARKR